MTHSPSPDLTPVRLWLHGARPHTWGNAIAPVIAGTVAAASHEGSNFFRAVLALIVSLFLIAGVNYANDYSDGIRGTDDDRSGPLRLTASGIVPPQAVKRAAFLCFTAAGVAGTILSLLSSWWLILIGLLCIAAAWFYTGGKNPYGYRGLGEIAVFIFFGLVAVLGTEFTQSSSISGMGILLAVTVGALSSSVNMVNNLRDIPTDTASGKITLAVRLGDTNTRRLWCLLVLTAPATTLILSFSSLWESLSFLLGFCVLPLLFQASRPIIRGAHGRDLIPVLGMTGKAMILWCLFIALGLMLTRLLN